MINKVLRTSQKLSKAQIRNIELTLFIEYRKLWIKRTQNTFFDPYKWKGAKTNFEELATKLITKNIDPVKFLRVLCIKGKFQGKGYLPRPGYLNSKKAFKDYSWLAPKEQKKYQNEIDMLKNLPEGVTTNRESILEQVREDHNYHWMHSRVPEETKREREHLFMLMLAKETSVSPWYLALSDKFYNSSCLEMVNDKETEKLYHHIKNCRAYYKMHPLLKKKAMEIFLSSEELDA